ncbi:protein kinase [Cytobacillus firmus]|uniref:protein kinase domain-containing protein n=1 Tax=Cytobacillus firmus TaxID=1399 RepID=UPI001CFDDB6C|nr:protein kinase [Cytobacillus firmus]
MEDILLYLEHKKNHVFYIENIIRTTSGKEYEIGERVSNGGNAVVYKCTERISGDEYAAKFQLTPYNSKRIERFKQEVSLLKDINHEQLINYIDEGEVCFRKKDKTSRKLVPERRKKIPFLIMRLANGNLTEHLKDRKVIKYAEYISQFKGLADALKVLHEKAIHRDIKPENILVSGETWLLSDFGLCKFNDNDPNEDLTADNEVVGPRYWMSPEALNKHIGNEDEINKSSDVYQLCSIFWYVVTGRHPLGIVSKEDWKENGLDELFQVIYDSLSHDSNKRPNDGEELLQRITAATIAI